IQTTTIFLNTVERRTWDFAKKSHILSFDEGNGTYTIKVKAEDAAGNIEEKVLSVQVLTEELIFFSNLTDSFYTQSGNFYVTINVTNTGIGLRNINLYIDNMKIYSDNFSETIQNESLTNYQIEILNSEYNALNGPHNIILTFVDRNYNEFSQQREFFIDNQKPEIFGTITFGSQILSVATPIQIFLNIDPAKNNYTIRATAIDNLRVKSMILRIEGEDFTQEYIMIANTSSETIVDFYLDLNVINFETGDYQLNFITTDYAGNINSEVFNVTISSQTVLPWILQENNLLYVSAGSALTLVLIGFISFVLRKRLVNRGWQDAISAVAYVFNGIPCVYVQSDPNLMGDEMLFGGAMTGVKGVIEEITGEISEKMDIHSVEVGSKIVLICPGEHGDGILMVSDVKPIHKEKLQGFVDEFERTYHDILTDEEILIQDETFRGASIIIGTHFGVRTLMDVDSCSPSLEEDVTFETIKEEDITYPEEEIEEYQPEQEFMEESTKEPEKTAYEYPEKEQEIEIEEPESLEEIVNQLPKEEKNTFLSLLELTPMAITALLEYNLETAEESNTEIISKLETLLQSEKLSRRLSIVLQNILKVSQEIAKGIDAGRKDNQTILQEAAENASKIWLTSIGEDIQ
ncbi:MAG: hypothetical protein U9O98_08480, partial [Asgard group archaeon]|nr:hypothetical protein [Asgard group archaeon]